MGTVGKKLVCRPQAMNTGVLRERWSVQEEARPPYTLKTTSEMFKSILNATYNHSKAKIGEMNMFVQAEAGQLIPGATVI